MTTFKRPELSDRSWACDLLSYEHSMACEHNFANIYLWATAYPQKIAQVGNRLVVQMLGGPGLSHLFPMGSGPLLPAVKLAEEDAQRHGVPLTFICLIDEQVTALEEEFPNLFIISEDRAGWDYLYRVDKLADLPGKKLHSKRNHIHRFCEQHPDWTFEPLTTSNLQDCIAMEQAWFYTQETSGYANYTLYNEREALLIALNHMEELDLSGGLIRANGTVLAFAMGSLTTPSCYNIHFEKASREIQGAYAIINQEVARWVRTTFPNVKYINREDDMGLDGLRKSKLSYYPDLMLKKYSAQAKQKLFSPLVY